jgi:serine O-acetyltransferase
MSGIAINRDMLAMRQRHEIPVSAEIPNWDHERPRQFWDPSQKLLLAIRRYQYWRSKTGPFAPLVRKWLVLRHRLWTIVTGADIPLNCRIGGGLIIPHPNGIVIHPEAILGVNCLILSQVTIGTRDEIGHPQLEGHVEVGAGAKILGPVRIGAHARIGANAVVITDVPAGASAVGIPAKIIIKSEGPESSVLG